MLSRPPWWLRRDRDLLMLRAMGWRVCVALAYRIIVLVVGIALCEFHCFRLLFNLLGSGR